MKIAKRALALIFVLILSFSSFAEVLTDNDGSSFITKAEFDSLKSSFQSQIDSYNLGIDSEIDQAISSYLAGIRVVTKANMDILVPIANELGVTAFNAKHPLEYKTCIPVSHLQAMRLDVKLYNGAAMTPVTFPSDQGFSTYYLNYGPPTDISKNKGSKTVIRNLDLTNKIAEWAGFHENCYDEIYGYGTNLREQWGYTDLTTATDNFCLQDAPNLTNRNICGENLFTHRQYPTPQVTQVAILETIVHNWGTTHYNLMSMQSDFDYDLFSNYDRDYNWGYPNDCGTKFILPGSSPTKYLVQDTHNFARTVFLDNYLWGGNIIDAYKIMCGLSSGYCYCAKGTKTGGAGQYNKMYNWISNYNNYSWDAHAYAGTTGNHTVAVPIIGFETSYLTSWNNIYISNYDVVVNDDYFSGKNINTILTGADGTKHLSVCAGFPLLKVKNTQKLLEFRFKFDDPSATYNIWFKDGPFDKSDPDSNACIDNIEGYQMSGTIKTNIAKDSTKTHAYKVSGKETVISIPTVPDDDMIIFVKWAKIASSRTNDGGGTFIPSKTYRVQMSNT